LSVTNQRPRAQCRFVARWLSVGCPFVVRSCPLLSAAVRKPRTRAARSGQQRAANRQPTGHQPALNPPDSGTAWQPLAHRDRRKLLPLSPCRQPARGSLPAIRRPRFCPLVALSPPPPRAPGLDNSAPAPAAEPR